MHHGTQLALLKHEKRSVTHRKVVYVPPSMDTVNQYASNICQRLARRAKAPELDTETQQGFAGFMRAAVSTHVNYLNRQQEGEEDAKQKSR